MCEFLCTPHAACRAQQRAIPSVLIEAVLDFADLELPVGEGRIALRLSRRALADIREELCPSMAERAKDVVLIVAGNTLVTVMHAAGAPSRRYRRRL